MMTFQGNSSLPTAKALIAEGSSSNRRCGPDAAGCPAYRNLWMGAGGGLASCMQNDRRKCNPVMQRLSNTRLGRTRTVIPPLVRPGNLRPHSLSKELSHSHPERPFILGYRERCELNACPAILIPSTFVLNGSSTFSFEKCKLSRPKVNYPTHNLPTVKDNQKSQSYPDPMVGAPRCFVHRISELSSLEGETVRQEKLKKMRKPGKPSS